MNLVVDMGNTRIKTGVFQGAKLIQERKDQAEADLFQFIKEVSPSAVLVSSVGVDVTAFVEQIRKNIPVVVLGPTTPIPIKNKYKTPETLGVDRIAGAVGAKFLFPNKNCLVIDTGTCITYEFIDDEGQYWGGGISPGLRMKVEALHNFTAKLPFIELENDVPLIGRSTEESMLSGVVNGTLAEIEEIIRMYKRKFANLQIVVCGGDSNFFKNKIKTDILIVPDLVLMGLNRILQHNDPKKNQ
ncbi:type III pantothenate kinase [Xanthovirga aplysinae]|uniref:type III pantothenate kinase n=1 Tax=Xanthovirga aplysinae TaxID=2529853 RepID=UPI0012BBABEB|nr:type III pantothenate kinase [Xanthovirga aplysinae]MTI33434.1 type III pantothenate kinase [Xanthovirga aplysinae]